ncbi:MAG: hypothetical protein ACOYEV_02655 [Candidatus Nanopelagicales bacterium]
MKRLTATTAASLLGLGLVAASPGLASAAEVEREKHGSCTGGSAVWELNLEKEAGRIDADLEIDSNRAGQKWKITFKHNGTTIYSGTRTTDSDGEVGVDRNRANKKGTDKFTFTATSGGQKCSGSLSI